MDYTVPFTKKSFQDFTTALNHRMTNIEADVKWMKLLGYYMAGLLTTVTVKLLFI